MRTTLFLCAVSTSLLLISCSKIDHERPPQHNTSCDLMQVLEIFKTKDETLTKSRFRKEYDPATGDVSKVVVGLFTFDLIDSVRLIPKYSNDDVHFMSEDNPRDTVITATFDASGRLLKLTQGNKPVDRLVTMAFSYASGKLSNLHFDFGSFTVDLIPSYDANGNVTQLKDPTEMAHSYFYTYDRSENATQQFYSDDFLGDGYNSLYFAEFMGWLPDLMPVNKRIGSRVVTGDYELYNATPTNHIFDENGKLLSYQSGATFTNIWNCSVSKGEHDKCHHRHGSYSAN